jgi:hypothetical protein
MIKPPVGCPNIQPFVEIGGEDVCLFDPADIPETIAQRILKFVDTLRPHKIFRNVIRNYVWDNIYHEKLLPLLETVIGPYRESHDCPFRS